MHSERNWRSVGARTSAAVTTNRLAGPPRPAEIMTLLLRQNFRCALTGQSLNPSNAALDHIKPICRWRQPHHTEHAGVAGHGEPSQRHHDPGRVHSAVPRGRGLGGPEPRWRSKWSELAGTVSIVIPIRRRAMSSRKCRSRWWDDDCKVAITGIYRYEDGAVSIDFRCEAGCEHSFYIHPDAKLQLVDLAPLHGEDAK